MFFFSKFQLFHFDLEVTPILEVLVGKVVEQSLVEVLEEEELATIRAQQNLFEELRQADLHEVQRLMEQDRRIRYGRVFGQLDMDALYAY